MKKKIAAVCLMLCLIIALSGCVRMDATIRVNRDRTVDVQTRIAMSKELASLGGEEDSFGLTDEEISTYKQQGYSYESYNDEDSGYSGYTLTRKGMDLKSSENNIDMQDAVISGDIFTVNGDHVTINFTPFPDEKYDMALLKSNGGYIKLNLELPVKPTKHNATSVSDDGRTLTWDLTKMKAGENIYAEFDFPSDSILLWLLPLILCILFFVIVFYALISTKRENSNDGQKEEDVEDDEIQVTDEKAVGSADGFDET